MQGNWSRQGKNSYKQKTIKMDTIECLKQRRCVREFLDKEISDNILKDIVDCARLAPSAINIQPWEFIVVKNKKLLKEIADLTDYGKFIKDSAACVIVVCKDTKYYLEDGCIASENILLAARAYGIGGCFVAGDKKSYCRDVLKLLEVPEDYKLVSILPLGYCSSFPKLPKKRELNEVFHLNKF
jgi:nitroreductase